MRLHDLKSVGGLRKKENKFLWLRREDQSLNMSVPVCRNQATE